MNYEKAAARAEAYIIEQRRWFHRHPELSWQEKETTEAILAELSAMGYETQRFPGKTGCCAILVGGKKAEGGKTVLLRADIDALPITERTGLPFASENAGVMHACGHDCHIAMLLGAAKLLVETKDTLCGTVKLLFQAAEETCGGALYYIEQGVLDDVDAVMGQHIWGTMEAPGISVEPGDRMASCDNFTIRVEGVAAHGTQPHLGVDALMAAASIVLNLQTFASRENDPMNPLVVTIGEAHAGTRSNIIASHAELYGTVRTFSPEFRMEIEEKLRRIVTNTAGALGATAMMDYEYCAPPVKNGDDALNRVARDAAVKLYGEEGLCTAPPTMISEDFAYYGKRVPSVFAFLGGRNEALGITAGNHSDYFTVDESVLKRGAALMAQFASDYLGVH